MAAMLHRLTWPFRWRLRQRKNDRLLLALVEEVARHDFSGQNEAAPAARPVVFFNASTRLNGLSQNAGFSLLSGWALRMAGVPVVHFVCEAGLSPCVLGTDRTAVRTPPPCAECQAQSRKAFTGAVVRSYQYRPDPALQKALAGLALPDLIGLTFMGMPLGSLVLPSLRWVLRRHTLVDDDSTRTLLRQYILSAWSVAQQFDRLLAQVKPQAVVLFNGMFYPEAAARHVALRRGLRTISHEVALRPLTAFFTTGEATAYPIDLPDSFQLSEEQNARLDAYLQQRLQGNFTMAGVRFWPEMRSLGDAFWEKAGKYRQVVPVFTNVIFDTSQGHANQVFPNMFVWLDQVLEIIQAHPETYFVIRAHPDENRPGKESLESVADWVRVRRVQERNNVLFVDSRQYFSSYELVQRSKFVMVYNSTIGLEAAILGAAVLCAGKARFTQLPTVFFPPTPQAHRARAEEFLAAERIKVPPEFQRNARRFLYTQLFKTSLPMDQFLEEDGIRRGYVRFKQFDLAELTPQRSGSVRVILDGILQNGSFLLEE
jgi:hypothetical protein